MEMGTVPISPAGVGKAKPPAEMGTVPISIRRLRRFTISLYDVIKVRTLCGPRFAHDDFADESPSRARADGRAAGPRLGRARRTGPADDAPGTARGVRAAALPRRGVRRLVD